MAKELTSHPPHVVILGGGSAGWITACLFQQRWGARGGSVTLVESPEIGIIGVGEGSTPELKLFFDTLGIAESEWMSACDATYKLGIRFTGWSERAGSESYFHPFAGPVDLHTEPGFFHNCWLKRRGIAAAAHPDDWFLAQLLAAQRKAPQPAASFPFAPTYGYHFDAYKLGGFLKDWATARGVRHVAAKVARVERAGDGGIAALHTDAGERLAGAVFVDCSGFRSLLMQETLEEPFLPFADVLFNDRAVVMPTPRGAQYTPQTEAAAMSAGWRWAIPLTTRVGNGYVYSSRHIGDAEAEAELRAAIGMTDSEIAARFLKMKVGRVERSWRGNCLATGLAQGFIEPLEATALHIAIKTARDFADAYEGGDFSDRHRDSFNARIAERYDGIRDYIVAHYRLNQRSDTAYWRDNAANQAIPDTLKAMMTAWFTGEDIAAANRQINGAAPAYAAMSWHALFAGYGTFPPEAKLRPPPPGAEAADAAAAQALLQACAANFAPLA